MDCPIEDFVAHTQHLVSQNLATAMIKNHISALRTMFKWFNKHLWVTDAWTWNLKSLTLATRSTPQLQSVVGFEHFVRAICLSESLGWYAIKMSFIPGFLGLLRISNLAPDSSHLIDATRHTLLRDINIVGTDLKVRIKWAKNLHTGEELLILPATNQEIFCPVWSWLHYSQVYLHASVDKSLPALLHQSGHQVTVIDQHALRNFHHYIWHHLALADEHFTPPPTASDEWEPPFLPNRGSPSKTSRNWGCGSRMPSSTT